MKIIPLSGKGIMVWLEGEVCCWWFCEEVLQYDGINWSNPQGRIPG